MICCVVVVFNNSCLKVDALIFVFISEKKMVQNASVH